MLGPGPCCGFIPQGKGHKSVGTTVIMWVSSQKELRELWGELGHQPYCGCLLKDLSPILLTCVQGSLKREMCVCGCKKCVHVCMCVCVRARISSLVGVFSQVLRPWACAERFLFLFHFGLSSLSSTSLTIIDNLDLYFHSMYLLRGFEEYRFT